MAGELVINPDDVNLGLNSGLSFSGTGLTGTSGSGVIAPQWVNDTSGSGSVLGTNTTYQAPDPYAQWGGISGYNTARQGIASGLSNIQQGGTDAFGNAKTSLQQNAQGIFTGIRGGQESINRGRQTNELNRMNATQDLLGYIRSGMRQGASRLASMNATDSSGTDALTRAYQSVGAQKSRGINNQAALQGRGLDLQQSDLNRSRDEAVTGFRQTRDNVVNQIGQDLRAKLAALDQQAVGLSLPDRIAVDQEKQRIIDAGMGQLQEVDQWLQGQLGSVIPQSNEQIQATAREMQQAGTATANPFMTGPLQQQQVMGPSLDQLPLFTARKRQG
jgi:hypothetical protein